jgi:hypothetical protein
VRVGGGKMTDVNHDGRPDLVTTAGDIFLRQPDGTLPAAPSLHLNVSGGKEWIGLAAADFNGDGRADLVFTANEEKALKVWIFYNTKNPGRPFDDTPAGFSLPEAHVSKDGPAAADWNGDGIADLVVCTPKGAVVLPGSREGLDLKRLAPLRLEYRPHGDAKFVVADFNGDGKMDLAGWGASMVGAAGVYIWLQP